MFAIMGAGCSVVRDMGVMAFDAPGNHWSCGGRHVVRITSGQSSGGHCIAPPLRQVRKEWAAAVEAEAARRHAADWEEEPSLPAVQSVEIPNSTAEELFHRLSADWKMVTNADKARLKETGSAGGSALWVVLRYRQCMLSIQCHRPCIMSCGPERAA